MSTQERSSHTLPVNPLQHFFHDLEARIQLHLPARENGKERVPVTQRGWWRNEFSGCLLTSPPVYHIAVCVICKGGSVRKVSSVTCGRIFLELFWTIGMATLGC